MNAISSGNSIRGRTQGGAIRISAGRRTASAMAATTAATIGQRGSPRTGSGSVIEESLLIPLPSWCLARPSGDRY